MLANGLETSSPAGAKAGWRLFKLVDTGLVPYPPIRKIEADICISAPGKFLIGEEFWFVH